MCIDIVKIWFGIADGQILQILTELSAQDLHIFSFLNNLGKCLGNLIKLGPCIDIKEIWVGEANGQILSIFDSYLPATQ